METQADRDSFPADRSRQAKLGRAQHLMELPEIGKEVERLLAGDPSGRKFKLVAEIETTPKFTSFAYYGPGEQNMTLEQYSKRELERVTGTVLRALGGDSVLSNEKNLRVALRQDSEWIMIYVGV